MSDTLDTPLPKELLELIQERYALGHSIDSYERITDGYLSRNFRLVTGNGQLFLKEYRYTDRARVTGVHQAKFFFAERDIPIITPLAQRDRETILSFDQRFYSVFPFVVGRIIPRVTRSLNAYRSSGEMLGRIHFAGRKGFEQVAVPQQDAWNPVEFLDEAQRIEAIVRAIPEPSEFDLLTLEGLTLKRELARKTPTQPDQLKIKNDHLIHGDYHSRNIFYNDQDEVSHVFDLEKACIAPRSFELARSMDFVCFSHVFEPENFTNGAAFLEGYTSVYSISVSEFREGLLKYYHKRMHSLWHEREHYLLGTTRVDGMYKNELTMLRWYSEHFEHFLEWFASCV